MACTCRKRAPRYTNAMPTVYLRDEGGEDDEEAADGVHLPEARADVHERDAHRPPPRCVPAVVVLREPVLKKRRVFVPKISGPSRILNVTYQGCVTRIPSSASLVAPPRSLFPVRVKLVRQGRPADSITHPHGRTTALLATGDTRTTH